MSCDMSLINNKLISLSYLKWHTYFNAPLISMKLSNIKQGINLLLYCDTGMNGLGIIGHAVWYSVIYWGD
jgi:hypothetical protein